jgi:uncharacterized protein
MPQPIHSIRYPFAIDNGFGVLQEEHDYDRHVEQLILQVLFTNPGERINRPDFGCGLRRMVFAPNSTVTAGLTQVMVVQSLEKWLGSHISVEEVNVSALDERLEVGITYILKVRQDRRYLNINVNL